MCAWLSAMVYVWGSVCFKTSSVPCGKVRSPYLGMAAAATRATLSIPTSVSAQHFRILSELWYGCWWMRCLTCTQVLRHAIAHRCCMNHCAKHLTGRKVLVTQESNLHQYCTWPFNQMLYPLSYISCPILCLCEWTPWDNRNGWLGIKHQITYLLTCVSVWVCMHVVVFTKSSYRVRLMHMSPCGMCVNVYTGVNVCLVIIIKSIYKAQNLVRRDCSKHIHANTEAPAYMSILTIQNLIYTQLKMGGK